MRQDTSIGYISVVVHIREVCAYRIVYRLYQCGRAHQRSLCIQDTSIGYISVVVHIREVCAYRIVYRLYQCGHAHQRSLYVQNSIGYSRSQK